MCFVCPMTKICLRTGSIRLMALLIVASAAAGALYLLNNTDLPNNDKYGALSNIAPDMIDNTRHRSLLGGGLHAYDNPATISEKGNNEGDKKYVAISTTLDSLARNENYAFIAGLAARNWSSRGFIPILIAVVSTETLQNHFPQVEKMWRMVLPKESGAIIVPMVVDDEKLIITFAQLVRLYATHLPELAGILRDDSFLRITDADAMIFDAGTFERKLNFDIDLFNGKAILYNRRKSKVHGAHQCTQYPMHSVGMNVGLWRELFPIDQNVPLLEKFKAITLDVFGPIEASVAHGGHPWYIDQILLGCVIDGAIKSKKVRANLGEKVREKGGLAVAGGVRRMGTLDPISNDYTDAHLGNFRIMNHEEWFLSLLNGTDLFGGSDAEKDKVREFLSAWKVYLNSNPSRYDKHFGIVYNRK